jgi:dihydrofolate synthase / folylpolyglutamate synthase
MPDHARSDDPAVQAQLDRLARLSPGRDTLGLDRITALLARLGNPHHRLPPVFHVAGTNGKGSTCAVLRAALEADGRQVHVYASPHLVRFNERIRLAGSLIGDAALARYLARALDQASGIDASFFEITTAAAFLAFAEHPADACVIEVGLGGRLDATNVIAQPAACGIAQLGIDHEAFLGSDPVGIALEKAGIARPGRPLVTIAYPADIRDAICAHAAAVGAPIQRESREWSYAWLGDTLKVVTESRSIDALPPALAGQHQAANAALAIAMLTSQTLVPVSSAALAAAPARATWPARLQRLAPGPLRDILPADATLWLDGGHNPAAAQAILTHFSGGPRIDIVIGMLANKDAAAFIATLAPVTRSLIGLPVPGHDHHAPGKLAALALEAGIAEAKGMTDLSSAIHALRLASTTRETPAAPPAQVAILGSLYLAGTALRLNEQLPD